MSGTNGHALDNLFRNKVQIQLGDETMWFRALSDLDLQSRDEYSILAMARRRRELDDPASRQHELYIVGLEKSPVEDLKTIILIAVTQEYRNEAMEQIKPNYYPFPDKATDEEKAETIQRRSDDETRVEKERTSFVMDRLAKTKASLETLEPSDLLKMAKDKNLEQQSRLVSLRAFQDYTVYASLFKDEECHKRRFESPDDVSQVTRDIRNQLVRMYFERVDTVGHLEIQYLFSTDGWVDSSKPKSSTEPTRMREPSRGGGRRRSVTGNTSKLS